ncbi:hypothetical protein KTN05_00365 [Paracoccus sp. Z118]|nr:hypothetical protein [Paracoccus sp. Z118]
MARFEASADRLEAAFLTEMLKHVGVDDSSSDFSGGAGEAQFASWLTEQRAGALSRYVDLKLVRQGALSHE